jgi:S-adenosylmethionine synthetase
MSELRKMLFTSESVTEGHPDKMCDIISDTILDEILLRDPQARVACETTTTTGVVSVMGEITTTANLDFQTIIREAVREIGYDRAKYGFDCDTCSVSNLLHKQSPDIAMGVDCAKEAKDGEMTDGFDTGAGDQGMMFGYACDETKELMPLPISLAHQMAKKLTDVRKAGEVDYLRPDGKTQVTVLYENDRPVAIDTVVLSTQHDDTVTQEQIRTDMIEKVIRPSLGDWWNEKIRIFVNPTGRFVVGGPQGDSGLTGRKIIVDTYGGYARHGGGAFSGKDPTKVDRTGAYAARYIAKNVVAAGLARKCEVQIAYAIGVAKPVSVLVDTFGTATIPEAQIQEKVLELVDLRPAALIERFGLRRPIYRKLAAYGHMGREDLNAPWEETDIAAKLAQK